MSGFCSCAVYTYTTIIIYNYKFWQVKLARDLFLPQQRDVVVDGRIQIAEVELADHHKVWLVNLEQIQRNMPQDN